MWGLKRLIDKNSQRAVRNAWKAYVRAQEASKQAREELIEELYAAHEIGNATFAELAAIMKVSRQRVGQYLKGVK